MMDHASVIEIFTALVLEDVQTEILPQINTQVAVKR